MTIIIRILMVLGVVCGWLAVGVTATMTPLVPAILWVPLLITVILCTALAVNAWHALDF